jgi:uncharacterized protein YkwD
MRTFLVGTLLALACLAPTAAPAAARESLGTGAEATYASAAVRATNAARAEHDRRALHVSDCLRRFAVKQAEAMAAAGSMFHQDLGAVMDGCGLNTAGENVAVGFATGQSVVRQGWMNSAGHRANILSRSFRLVAVAARRDDGGAWYAAQVFGRRA